ncbi:hypothetical protein M8818_005952 [Zalaria obscura]|uniref:Uncharacterized protein n=1 Tax=Zalaria obscura TaxID=2024903 RepID=A0ACC3SAW7_9PEZI
MDEDTTQVQNAIRALVHTQEDVDRVRGMLQAHRLALAAITPINTSETAGGPPVIDLTSSPEPENVPGPSKLGKEPQTTRKPRPAFQSARSLARFTPTNRTPESRFITPSDESGGEEDVSIPGHRPPVTARKSKGNGATSKVGRSLTAVLAGGQTQGTFIPHQHAAPRPSPTPASDTIEIANAFHIRPHEEQTANHPASRPRDTSEDRDILGAFQVRTHEEQVSRKKQKIQDAPDDRPQGDMVKSGTSAAGEIVRGEGSQSNPPLTGSGTGDLQQSIAELEDALLDYRISLSGTSKELVQEFQEKVDNWWDAHPDGIDTDGSDMNSTRSATPELTAEESLRRSLPNWRPPKNHAEWFRQFHLWELEEKKARESQRRFEELVRHPEKHWSPVEQDILPKLYTLRAREQQQRVEELAPLLRGGAERENIESQLKERSAQRKQYALAGKAFYPHGLKLSSAVHSQLVYQQPQEKPLHVSKIASTSAKRPFEAITDSGERVRAGPTMKMVKKRHIADKPKDAPNPLPQSVPQSARDNNQHIANQPKTTPVPLPQPVLQGPPQDKAGEHSVNTRRYKGAGMWTKEEDDLLTELRLERKLDWNDVPQYFQNRTKAALQQRQSALIKQRRNQTLEEPSARPQPPPPPPQADTKIDAQEPSPPRLVRSSLPPPRPEALFKVPSGPAPSEVLFKVSRGPAPSASLWLPPQPEPKPDIPKPQPAQVDMPKPQPAPPVPSSLPRSHPEAKTDVPGSLPAPPASSSTPPGRQIRFRPWTAEEDVLLKKLKVDLNYTVDQMVPHFPGRTKSAIAQRCSNRFAHRLKEPSSSSTVERPVRTLSGIAELGHGFDNMDHISEADELPTLRSSRGLVRKSKSGFSYYSEPAWASGATSTMEEETETEAGPPERAHEHTAPRSVTRIMRHRELGTEGGRTWQRQKSIIRATKNLVYDSLGPSRYQDDASGDVSTVAWSPHGRFFAAGAVAVSDVTSMQYNRPRNLFLGDVDRNELRELPEHYVRRPIPKRGENSTHSMVASQDPRLFTTVQQVAFAPDGSQMYSASMDGRVNAYKIRKDVLRSKYMYSIPHPQPVHFLSVGNHGSLATGCRTSGKDSIKILKCKKKRPEELATFSAPYQNDHAPMFPSALRWGGANHHRNYLLAAFTQEFTPEFEEDDPREKYGETCLWDVTTQQRIKLTRASSSVFDLNWNPNPSSASTSFAVACMPDTRVNEGTNSVVRLYAPSQKDPGHASFVIELECPGYDINDVLYSPYDDHLIVAGDTEGKVYLWDTRMVRHDQAPLRTFAHGPSVSVLAHGKPTWRTDTGIRFISWGASHDRLYSGSSDGVVKCWNPFKAGDDALVRDVATFQDAVMSGAFSPDYEKLLIGQDGGRLNLLEIGCEGRGIMDMERFEQYNAPELGCSKKAAKSTDEVAVVAEVDLMREESPDVIMAAATPEPQAAQEQCPLDCGYTYEEPWADRSWTKRFPTDIRAKFQAENAKHSDIAASHKTSARVAKPSTAKLDFACLRCGEATTTSPRGLAIECQSCGRAWRIGVLGYELVEDPAAALHKSFERMVLDVPLGDEVDIEDAAELEREY